MIEQLLTSLDAGPVTIRDFNFSTATVTGFPGPPGAPAAGSFHQATIVNNNQIFSFGGYSGAGKSTVFKMTGGGTPTSLAALPTTIYGGLVVFHNGKFYNFGGTRGDSSTDFIVYDPIANTHSRVTAPGLPLAMHTVAGYANGKIYMPQCNGTTNYYIYDIEAKTLETISLTSLGVAAIFERATIVVGNYAYSFGGRATRAGGAATSNVAYRMNLTTKAIELLPNMSSACFPANNLFTNGRQVYVVAPSAGTTPINKAMVMDTTTLLWTDYTTPGGMRCFSANGYLNNKLYFMGGIIGVTEQTNGVVYATP